MARRRWLPILGLALLLGVLGWWVWSVTLMPTKDRADAVGYGQFVLATVGVLLTVWPYIHPHLRRRQGEVSVDEIADRLAAAVRAQWAAAVIERGLRAPSPLPIRWRRCPEAVAGPIAAATKPQSPEAVFSPLPGLEPVTAAQLREGTHRMLHRIYGGLASGRLILAGEPGSGKSSAAILLLLEALHYRDRMPPEDRAQVPVPVLFTLAGWDPDTTPVNEWLAGKLTELRAPAGRHGRDQANRLLAAGRIAVFLDGLDEIPEHHRPTALHALARQATFRLVLLTRTAELAAATQHHILTGAAALELQPLTASDAATYLRNALPDPPPAPWHQLLTTLTTQPTAPSTRALNNPLTITLLRDTYQPSPAHDTPVSHADELLDTTRFPTPHHITNHLLDHAITTAYTPRPGQPPPRYTPHTAQHTLTLIAQHLRDRDTRDLTWWDIPDWIPATPRSLITNGLGGAVVAVMFALIAVLADGLTDVRTMDPLFGLVFGLLFGVVASDSKAGGVNRPRPLAWFRWDKVWRTILSSWPGPMIAFLFEFAACLIIGFSAGPEFGLVAGLAAGLAGCLALGWVAGIDSGDPSKVSHPKNMWRADLVAALVTGLVVGLGIWLTTGVMTVIALEAELSTWLMIGLHSGLIFALISVLIVARAWDTALSQIYLTVRYHTPLRLGRFLVDAHERHLLRTVGPTYQFRHATLQDRLAPPQQRETSSAGADR